MPALKELLIAREGDRSWVCGSSSSALVLREQVAVGLGGRAGRGMLGGGVEA